MKHNESLYRRFIRWAEGDPAAKDADETAEHAEFVEYLEYLDSHEHVDYSTYHHIREQERAAHGLPVEHHHSSHEVVNDHKRKHSDRDLHPHHLHRATMVYRVLSVLLALFLMGTFLVVALNLPAFGDPNAPAVNEVSDR